MKKLLFFLFLMTSSPVFSLEKSSFLISLRDEIEDNYAVIKKSPENPYQVSVSIYLKNKDVTIHKGNLSVRILTPDINLLTNKTFPANSTIPETILHCHLPDGMKIAGTNVGTIISDKSAIRIKNKKGRVNFEFSVKKEK